jgi:DNA-binding CsgD family transcriptional regulator
MLSIHSNKFVTIQPKQARLKRRHRVARSLSERCPIIVRCADGLPSKSVAAELGVHEHTVGKWRRRFLKDRCDGLLHEARPGRPQTIDDVHGAIRSGAVFPCTRSRRGSIRPSPGVRPSSDG